jgi:hypothetical protein
MTKDLGLDFKSLMKSFDFSRGESLETKLLTKPWLFARAICAAIPEIDEKRVGEIVMDVAAPRDNKGNTKKITFRGLSTQEISLILAKITEGKDDYGDQILSVQRRESEIEIKIKPDLASMGDLLLLQPWIFIRTVGELSGLDDELVSQLAMSTTAPKNGRNLTERLTLSLKSETALFDRIADQFRLLEPILKSNGVNFTLLIDKNSSTIDLAEIVGEPSIFFVEQGKHVISQSEVQTAGLDTCTAVGITFSDGSKFLAHVDAQTNTMGLVTNNR